TTRAGNAVGSRTAPALARDSGRIESRRNSKRFVHQSLVKNRKPGVRDDGLGPSEPGTIDHSGAEDVVFLQGCGHVRQYVSGCFKIKILGLGPIGVVTVKTGIDAVLVG